MTLQFPTRAERPGSQPHTASLRERALWPEFLYHAPALDVLFGRVMAEYAEFPNAAQPVENGYPGAAPYRDLSGRPLAGAPKWTGNVGLNAATGEFEDLLKAGVIDPAKVTRAALQNAASIASLLLTTEALIADKPEEAGAGMPGGGMPDMGGMGMM
mgnify:CR=1 FL=1